MDARHTWGWAARRLGISAFLVVHVSATLIWVMPPCPIRARCFGLVSRYIMPLGLWQYWGMFAPDPMSNSFTLSADVVDVHGLRYSFPFPKLSDYSALGRIPRFRHPKFAANLSIPELELQRKLAARHVLRQLGLPAESFPAVVRLEYQVRATPPPGGPPADPMAPTIPYTLGTFRFTSLEEVRP
jgi:hypothetical protein